VRSVTTPGTRVQFHDVRTWAAGYVEIHARAPSAQRYEQLSAHLGGLTRELIAQDWDAGALRRLRELFEEPRMQLKPMRGQRAGSAYEMAVTQVHNRLRELERTPRAVRAVAWAFAMSGNLFEPS
jgi:hypothetical protein